MSQGTTSLLDQTSILCKVLERMTRDSKEEPVLNTNIMSGNQNRFMKGQSFQSKLLTCYEEVSKHLYKRRAMDAIYLNFVELLDT